MFQVCCVVIDEAGSDHGSISSESEDEKSKPAAADPDSDEDDFSDSSDEALVKQPITSQVVVSKAG